MHMDLTITLGNVISTAAAVGAVLASYLRLRDQIVVLRTQMEPLWKAYLEGKIH